MNVTVYRFAWAKRVAAIASEQTFNPPNKVQNNRKAHACTRCRADARGRATLSQRRKCARAPRQAFELDHETAGLAADVDLVDDGHDHRVELGESLASSLGGLVETSAALDAAKVQQ